MQILQLNYIHREAETDTAQVNLSYAGPCQLVLIGVAQSINLMLYRDNTLVLEQVMGGGETEVTVANTIPGALYTATIVAGYKGATGSKTRQT